MKSTNRGGSMKGAHVPILVPRGEDTILRKEKDMTLTHGTL